MLGAGATRGASTSKDKLCLPPLNADFFTQLQRINSDKHRQTIKDVVADVVDLFGPNFRLTLEDYFTQLESMRSVAKLVPKNEAAFSAPAIRSKRDRLMAALAAVLEESTDVSRKASRVCEHHVRIVNNLQARDTIISFNYDCVIDHALRSKAQGKWTAKYGYCFPRPARIEGFPIWDAPNAPQEIAKTINLLKLHGSLHWQLPRPDREDHNKAPIYLKQRLYTQNGTPRFTIIPPEFVKRIDNDPVFRTLWGYAERALRMADEIALIGFSFTPTDLHVEALFRIALTGSKLKTLVIANPNSDHRRRIRSVFSSTLRNKAVVRQFDSIEEFASSLG